MNASRREGRLASSTKVASSFPRCEKGKRGLAVLAAAAIALPGLVIHADPAVATCKIVRIAELPVTLIGRRAMVDAKFGSRDARFIVDSGAFYSTLSRASAVEFGVTTEPAPNWFRLRGINGDTSADFGKTKDFSLAGIAMPPVSFIVGGTDTGTAGLLGQNILGLADVEYDLPHGSVRLMRTEGCERTELAYWAGAKPSSMIPLEPRDGPWKPHTIGTVLVNGVKMRATFDTGAPGSSMTLAAAKRLGVTPSSPGVVTAGSTAGLGSKHLEGWLATFDRIDLGGEMVPRPKFRIADMQIDTDMLIGFDFFLTHRVFVSNATHRMFVTYEGGTVFGLSPAGARTATGERLDLVDRTADPTGAEGFARRGAVEVSNRRFVEGLADFDKAVGMAPAVGRYRYLRARARLAADQPALAAADLDKAIELMPIDVEPRLQRIQIRLKAGDLSGGKDDADAADRTLAAGSDDRIELAGVYVRLDEFDRAIANYDAWLKLHPEDADRATAYNGRCWARGMLNRELSKALSDCRTAVRLRPGYGPYLDSRALVELRLGMNREALADYDEVVKTMPRNAWTLYARSIVETRVGRIDAADRDRSTASAVDPRIPERAKKFSVVD